jgi:hypothetical protein
MARNFWRPIRLPPNADKTDKPNNKTARQLSVLPGSSLQRNGGCGSICCEPINRNRGAPPMRMWKQVA